MKYDIKNLTFEEKLHLLTGKDSWQLETANGKLPQVFLSDGPNGLRMHDITKEGLPTIKATAMPNIHALANTWSEELAFLDGETIADDCIEHGADVLLAPGVNIKRTPLCGRNFEYFSEDPFLAGTLAKAYIEGVQSKGVGTSLKHFCANNREYDRHFISSEMDERTIREIYLPAFEIAVQAQPWTVMCSYNPINGVWASENQWLLTDILRDEFGFEGMVVSDWGATHQAARAAKAGLDLTMPYRKESFDELKSSYENGFLTMEEIDRNVSRILTLIEKTQNDKKEITTTKAQRHENAVKIAQEGIVLLKNEDKILPLEKGKTVFACGWNMNEPILGGGGSAYVQTDYKQPPLDKALQDKYDGTVQAYPFPYGAHGQDYFFGGTPILQKVSKADYVVFNLANTYVESESKDRTNLLLPENQIDFLKRVAALNQNIVVVLAAGSAIDVSEWEHLVKGIVYIGFLGEAAHEATADILTGKVCPCGKLSETFPLNLESASAGKYDGNGFVDIYKEGVFVGYRYYDTFEKEVRYPFGFGLSYADFEYSNLKIEKKSETDYDVSFTVKNTSSVDAKEISQVYVRDVFSRVARPLKELKGFAKTALKAGESKTVRISLNARSFAYYSTAWKKWHIENGEFEILVGSSSKDIRLKESVEISLPFETQFTVD